MMSVHSSVRTKNFNQWQFTVNHYIIMSDLSKHIFSESWWPSQSTDALRWQRQRQWQIHTYTNTQIRSAWKTHHVLQYDHLEPLKSKCFVWSLYSIIFNFITCLDIVTMGHFCFYLFFLIRFQWDRKGPEFRTWSGSGPKCQKWSGKGPELATRSWMFLDAPDMTEYTNVYIYIIYIQWYQGHLNKFQT